MWVSPFRYLRINGYLLLPEAFRSLSRLSSALSAKASTLRSFMHNQLEGSRGNGFLPHMYSVTCVGSGQFFYFFFFKVVSLLIMMFDLRRTKFTLTLLLPHS